ncbi:MAG: DegV family protein [Lachnospiraceae bacterium]|nr:DegV family protein [Lachnospiraceae bacterium]
MFDIITDSASNLTEDLAVQYNIKIVSYVCNMDGVSYMCYEPGRDDEKDGKFFYDKLREDADVTTSLLSPGTLMEVFEQSLEQGRDVLFVAMSSGLTGTYQSALIAKEELEDKYPDNKCVIVDSLAASLGEGFMAIEASKLRDKGMSLSETAEWIDNNKLKMRHIFTVDNLKYLRKGGRISASASLVGNVLGIKPILYATDLGKIELYKTVRGRKKSLSALIDDYRQYCDFANNPIVGIAHCDCKEDALHLENEIKIITPDATIINRVYDRCSGTHVGPGAICLFYMGKDRGY